MVTAAVLLADLLSGLAHWIEDSYFTPSTPGLGPTIAKNVAHHLDPTLFLSNPWHVTIRSSLICAVIVVVPVGFAGGLRWWVGLALCVAVFANQVHKWAHMPVSAVPEGAQVLQRWGILQSPAHHAAHHAEAKNRQYCVVTNVMNPVLDGLGVWRLLEHLVYGLTGSRPRPAISLQPYYYRPAARPRSKQHDDAGICHVNTGPIMGGTPEV